MQPGNPAFGSTVLRIPAEQSPNFVTGVSGWFIGQDGHIEANDATIRGTITAGEFDGTDFIINSDGAFYYSGTPAAGNLIASNAPAAGTDTFGNVYNAGVQSYIPGIGAAGLAAGKLNLYQWTGSAWSAYGGLVADGTALDVNNTNGGGVKIPNGPFTSTGGTTASPTIVTTDSGTLVSSFGTGWAASGSAVNGVWFLLLPDGMVYCAIDVKTSSATPGGTICTIPAAYVPNTNITGGHVNNPGTPANGSFSVTANSSANLTISVPGSVSGVRYAGSFMYPGPAYTA